MGILMVILYGQNFNVYLRCWGILVWSPQSFVSALGRRCGSTGFIKPQSERPLQVGDEILPQVEDFMYFVLVLTSEREKWTMALTVYGGEVQHVQ